jgi:hypothetical protein
VHWPPKWALRTNCSRSISGDWMSGKGIGKRRSSSRCYNRIICHAEAKIICQRRRLDFPKSFGRGWRLLATPLKRCPVPSQKR